MTEAERTLQEDLELTVNLQRQLLEEILTAIARRDYAEFLALRKRIEDFLTWRDMNGTS